MEETKFLINKTSVEESRLKKINWNDIKFGRVFTDHMLVMDFVDGEWQTPELVPFGNITHHPALLAIHYGQAIFEGMKAYKMDNGTPVIFRPDMNAKRFRLSAQRLGMADIPEELFEFCVEEFVSLERGWVPEGAGSSLYLRPFMYATDAYIGIKASETYRFMIIASPAVSGGVYYNAPLKVKIEETYTRAAQGGVGAAKAAGNYAAALYPEALAKKEGYQQLIWTDANTHEFIEEAGTMNILFVKDGKVITPAESDTILHGITKRSVVEVAKDLGYTVEERKITVKEIVEGLKDGSVVEAFGAGTAATIAPIQTIGFRGENHELTDDNRVISKRIAKEMEDIRFGKIEDRFGWLRKV
ncbi:MAG TPA: branched-chain amino acid aminotransferase [Brumimicrobium sp.]|nr:branched-chain amino acid aminotransferase [Brumimicrobium sp.]